MGPHPPKVELNSILLVSDRRRFSCVRCQRPAAADSVDQNCRHATLPHLLCGLCYRSLNDETKAGLDDSNVIITCCLCKDENTASDMDTMPGTFVELYEVIHRCFDTFEQVNSQKAWLKEEREQLTVQIKKLRSHEELAMAVLSRRLRLAERERDIKQEMLREL